MMYLTSSQPLTVTYDPNTLTYTPDWGTSNLVLTPVIQYNGTSLPLNSQGLTITYKRKDGSSAAEDPASGETVSGGILTVSANKMPGSSGIITYICKVVYNDPNVGVPIETESSMTFTQITQASELKYAYIVGESTFLYGADRSLVGSDTIMLSTDISNTSVSQWQYKNSLGDFVPFPTTYNESISGRTLTVKAAEQNIWLNSKTAIIKLTTTDSGIYDIHQISKLYDGVAGNDTITAVLSNQAHYLPCNSDGTVRSWNGSSTEIHVYEGGQDDTNNWTITVTKGSGLDGVYDATTHVFTPNSLTDDVSYADFVCQRTGYSSITCRYTITKQMVGADGADAVLYNLRTNTLVINIDNDGIINPESVTFTGQRIIGDVVSSNDLINQDSNQLLNEDDTQFVVQGYFGRFKIYETTNGIDFTIKYTSSEDEIAKVYAPSSSDVVSIRCELYAGGGFTTRLDEQTVVVTKDGKPGQDGLNGVSMALGNYQDVIPCTSNGVAASSRDISIPFYGRAGITRLVTTANVGTLPSGVTIKNNIPSTTSSDGMLVLNVVSGATFGNLSALTGDITITLSCVYEGQTQTSEQKYTWTKNIKAVDGESAVSLSIYSEDGGVIRNSSGSTTLKTLLLSGGTEVSPTSVQWAKFSAGTYQNLTGATQTSLVVTGDMVEDLAFFKATVVFNNNSYNAYYTVDDIVDEYTAYTFSTVNTFKNGEGYGAIYTRVYRGGTEVDPIKSTVFSNSEPANPSEGDYYYHLNPSTKMCVLRKYTNSAWGNANEPDQFVYRYYRRDGNGDVIDTDSAYKQMRCFFIDPSMFVDSLQFVCEVSDS